MLSNSSSVVNKYNKIFFEFRNQPYIKIEVVPPWQKIIKRSLDIIIALAGLIILFPLLIYIGIRIKLDSKGSIFYVQERIGYNGIPFTIFKFRSMYEDAENDGPVLSSIDDSRVTKWGSTIRKWKLDELPQLLNILISDMSLVGPRPERKYYIDKVSVIYPYFKYLHQVKPGLTSLGMIKFGYAQNIEQIIQRMRYDITYIESYSLFLDLQIVYYTFRSIIDDKIFTTSINLRIRLPRVKIPTFN